MTGRNKGSHRSESLVIAHPVLFALVMVGIVLVTGSAYLISHFVGDYQVGGRVSSDDEHEMVYIPASYISSEEDFFGEPGLFGVTINGQPEVIVVHIGVGGLRNSQGKVIGIDDLETGDIVRCSFNMITMSIPGQTSVNMAQLVRKGGVEALAPYRSAIDALKSSMVMELEAEAGVS